MIVPSQRHLGRYLSPAQSQYAPEAIVSPITYTPPLASMRVHRASNLNLRTPTPMAGNAFPMVPSQPRSIDGLAKLSIQASEYDVPVFAHSADTPLQMASGASPTGGLRQCEGHSPPPSPASSIKKSRRTRTRSPSTMSSPSSSTVALAERTAVVKLSQIEKKPLVLACLFCRARKIACAPALPGSGETGCK